MIIVEKEKAVRFRALYDGPGAFVIPNPGDVGSAHVLIGLGFPLQPPLDSRAAPSKTRRATPTLCSTISRRPSNGLPQPRRRRAHSRFLSS